MERSSHDRNTSLQSRSEKIVVRVARCRIPGLEGARGPLMDRLQQFNEKNKPARPEAEETAPSVSAFIAALEDSSSSTGKKSTRSLRKNEEESCTEAIICVAGNCWQDSAFGCENNGDSSNGSNGQRFSDTGVGGGGAPPSTGNSGDGGESPDPCDGTRTSICDDSDSGPESPKELPQVQDFNPEVDTVKIDELPDCSLSDSQAKKELPDSDFLPTWKDYCESSPPNATQRQRIKNALDRIEKRGEVCEQIAQRARSYLYKNLIYFDPTANRASGWGNKGLVIIWEKFVDRFYGDSTKEDYGWARDGSLQSILVHEFEHVMGEEGHKGPTAFSTTHELQCSNLSSK